MDGDKNVTATFRAIVVAELSAVAFDPIARSVSLTWNSQVETVYEIEMSTDLLGWESLGMQMATGEQTAVVVDTVPEGDRRRFYRLRKKVFK